VTARIGLVAVDGRVIAFAAASLLDRHRLRFVSRSARRVLTCCRRSNRPAGAAALVAAVAVRVVAEVALALVLPPAPA
jgi:hypothetical protein